MRTAVALTAVFAGVALAAPAGAPATTIYAASSLRTVFPQIDPSARFSFAGSGQLQLQIERGAPADLFAAASAAEPRALFRAGRCGRPATFATNNLVMIVPAKAHPRVRSPADLARAPRRRVAVGAPGVPVGAYTRSLLARMGLSHVLTRNLISNEQSAAGVLSKVALGSADAGFVYATDARSAGRRVRAIGLPAKAQPPIRYAFCIVRRRGVDAAGAQRFVNEVRSARGRRLLRAAGFGTSGA